MLSSCDDRGAAAVDREGLEAALEAKAIGHRQRRFVRDVLRLAILFGLASMLACSLDVSLSLSFKISANARVLSPAAAQQAEVSQDNVTLPAAAVADQKIEVGSILVTEDFVRRATRVDQAADKVSVTTEDASLADVIEEGESETVEDLGARTEVRSAWGTVSPKAIWTGKGFEFDVVHQTVVDDPTLGARVWLDGRVYFHPVLDVGIKFGVFSLKSAHAIARGEFGATLTATGRVAAGVSRTYSIVLWRSPSFSVPLPPIGPVPIVFKSQLTVRAVVTVSAVGAVIVQTSVDLMASGGYGFRYDDGKFSAVHEWSASGTVAPPTIDFAAALDLRAALRAELDGGFAGGWGPLSAGGGLRLGAEAWADLHVDPTSWKARAGLKADAQASLKLLWREVPVGGLFRVYPAPGSPSEGVLKEWIGGKPSTTSLCKPDGAITCGGWPGCTLCKSGASCILPKDCSSGVCAGGFCAGSAGAGAPGSGCATDADCAQGGLCARETLKSGATEGRCRAAHCSNEVRDADEPDNDCGGKDCSRCLQGSACRVDGDCVDGWCVGGKFCWHH
jgi:hypothetical protein